MGNMVAFQLHLAKVARFASCFRLLVPVPCRVKTGLGMA